MKKIILSVSCLLASAFAFAGGNGIKGDGSGVLSNGFYINLGAAFPTLTWIKNDNISTNTIPFWVQEQKIGTQPNIEIGNQWYFYHNDNFGVGLKAGWFQFGYSAYTNTNGFNVFNNGAIKSSALDLRVLKVAPMVSYAINDDFAIDGSFEFAPSLIYLMEQEKGNPGRNDLVGTVMGGITFSPGLRIRYTMFCLGYDYNFGTLYGKGTIPDGTSDETDMSQKIAGSRVYLGLKF